MAEYSDEDEEGEFSSGEENDDAIDLGIGGYTERQKNNLRKYSEFELFSLDFVLLTESFAGSNQVDSDSEFEMKDKGLSRAKISRVSICWKNFIILLLVTVGVLLSF